VFILVSPAILFFIWMLSLSLKTEVENSASPPVLFPANHGHCFGCYLLAFPINIDRK
jgi:hypothetical protein